MQPISPSIKHVAGFQVRGLCVRTQNRDEFHESTAKLPKLWQQLYSSGLTTNTNIFGVYSDYESDANGLYTVTVGIASKEEHAPLSSVAVQTGNYLVFQSKGPMPATLIETWKCVWNYFEKTNKYHRNFLSDFEAYSNTDEVAIHIGIK